MKNIEIRKVSNGYVVVPAFNQNVGTSFGEHEVSVFETFEGLTKFLADNFEVQPAKER